MFIQTNISALQALRYSQMNYLKMNKLMEQLSTGLRINRAADDAAGLAISQSMQFQINGYKQATRNIQDGISLIETAQGALTTIHSIAQRMAVLANQASNGIYSDQDRNKLALEFNELKKEINSITSRANFNGIPLLDGQYSLENSSGLQIQAGYEAGDVITIDMPNLLSLSTTLDDLDISTLDGAKQALASFESIIDDVSYARAKLGASQNRMEHRINYLHNSIENLTASMSRIQDTDYAKVMTEFVKSKILFDASTAMLVQANALPLMLLKLLEAQPKLN